MSESKHTPGPWTVTDAIWDSSGDVAYILTGVKDACAADARLIAAAPDLLEAVRLFIHYDTNDDEDGLEMMQNYAAALDAAKEAIAKVEGTQP